MSIHSSKKIVLIHTHGHLSSACGQLMQDSVAQMKGSDGCIYCQLQAEEPRFGLWVIRCEWNTMDSMRASVEEIFQPAFENLLSNNALLSISVCEDDYSAEVFKVDGEEVRALFYRLIAN